MYNINEKNFFIEFFLKHEKFLLKKHSITKNLLMLIKIIIKNKLLF